MLELHLFDFKHFKDVKVVVDSVNFAPSQGYAIIFIKLHLAEQRFLDWISENEGVKLMTWFDDLRMRVWIPMKYLDHVTTYKDRPIPTYVPNPDLD